MYTQIAWPEGLSDDLMKVLVALAVRQIAVTGHEDDRHQRVQSMHLVGEFGPAHPSHDDVDNRTSITLPLLNASSAASPSAACNTPYPRPERMSVVISRMKSSSSTTSTTARLLFPRSEVLRAWGCAWMASAAMPFILSGKSLTGSGTGTRREDFLYKIRGILF